jgi:hypothetical protein
MSEVKENELYGKVVEGGGRREELDKEWESAGEVCLVDVNEERDMAGEAGVVLIIATGFSTWERRCLAGL